MPRLDLFKIAILSLFAIPIGAWEFAECLHIWRARAYPMAEGDVVRREEFRRWGGIPAGRLTVRVLNSPHTVLAEVRRFQMDELPQRVHFHFTGNPSDEVFLEGESNPVWVVMIMWGSPVVLLGVYLALRGKRGWEHVVGP